MSYITAVELGVEKIKIVNAKKTNNSVKILKTFQLDSKKSTSAFGNSMPAAEVKSRIKDFATLLNKVFKDNKFKGNNLILILPQWACRAELWSCAPNLKEVHLKKWMKENLESKFGVSYSTDVVTVDWDFFGKSASGQYGSCVSVNTEYLELLFGQLTKKYKIKFFLPPNTAYSYLSSVIGDNSHTAVVDVNIESFNMHIFNEGILADTQSGHFNRASLLTKIAEGMDCTFYEAVNTSVKALTDPEFSLTKENPEKFQALMRNALNEYMDVFEKRLNVVRGKKLYPTNLVVVGEIANIEGLSELFSSFLKIPCKNLVFMPNSKVLIAKKTIHNTTKSVVGSEFSVLLCVLGGVRL